MKLETVSKIKGWVALGSLSLALWLVMFAGAGTRHSLATVGASCLFPVGLVYAVKWFRLRRRMRMLEYQGRVIAGRL